MADMTRIEVTYVDGFNFEDPIIDADGEALTAGGPENGDGAIFQVGYFQGVPEFLSPASYGGSEWSQFTPLTGIGSPNGDRHPIGQGNKRA